MKKKVLYLLISIISLMFIACDTDANQSDISKPDVSEPEEAKTSISVILGFQDIKETGLLSFEVTILKGKDTIATFTLTSENNEKTIEVEAGEYTVVTTLLENGVPPKADTYSCSVSEELFVLKEGEEKKVNITISPFVNEEDEGEGNPVPSTRKLVLDLGNYFGIEVNYSITPSLPNKPIVGKTRENIDIEVPLGIARCTFDIEEDNDYYLRTGNSPKTKTFSFDMEFDSDYFQSLYVAKEETPSKPTLIINPTIGSDLLGDNNKYGDCVGIYFEVTPYSGSSTDPVYGTLEQYGPFYKDGSFSLAGSGGYKLVFKIVAKNDKDEDTSSCYSIEEDTRGGYGSIGYEGNSYSYWNFKITRIDNP